MFKSLGIVWFASLLAMAALSENARTQGGVGWQRLHSGNALPRESHAIYDAARQRIVMWGRFTTLTSSWEWDGTDWTSSTLPGGLRGPRMDFGLAYDPIRGSTLAYGGAGVRCTPIGCFPGSTLADTWESVSLSPASFTTSGSNCPGSLGNLTLRAARHSAPWLGDTLDVVLGNVPGGSLPFMVLGLSNVGGSLPRNLSAIGLTGCWQLNSAETAVGLTLNANTATWSGFVPVNPTLVGWSLFFQGAALNAGGANVLGAALSNGGEATIGMR